MNKEAFEAPLRAEFEAWAKERGHPLCDVIPKYGPASSMSETTLRFSDIAWEAYRAATERAAKQEREECAELCDAMSTSDYLPLQCATAIRNRAPCTCKPGLASEQTCERHAAQNSAAAIRGGAGKGAAS